MRNSFVLKYLPKSQKNSFWIFLETIIMTGFILGFCYLTNPKNPLFINAIFPWPWLAPILLTLRYGVWPGLLSAFMINLLLIFMSPMDVVLTLNHQNYIFSCFGITLLIGLINSSMLNRCMNNEELLAYCEEKTDDLLKSYYLMHISHNDLEKNLIIQPVTIRSVMKKLKEILITQKGDLTPDLAYQFLQVICQHCSASIAGIYLYHQKELEKNPCAEIGNMDSIQFNDPVLKYALKTNEMAYIHNDSINGNYLIAAPLQDAIGNLKAILVIKEMAFKKLTLDTLRILKILINYFMREFNLDHHFLSFLDAYPNCPPLFIKEFQKLIQLKQKINVDSALIAIMVSKDLEPYNVIFHLQSKHRMIDTVWSHEIGHFDVLIMLMPLTNAIGIKGYFDRIAESLKKELGITVDQDKIKTRSLQLINLSSLDMMKKFMKILMEATEC